MGLGPGSRVHSKILDRSQDTFFLFATGNLSYSLLSTHVWLVFSDMLPCKTTSQKISVHLFAALVKDCHDEEYGMDRVML